MAEIIYPSSDKIIEYNFLILRLIKVKKADQPKVLSHSKIRESIDECSKQEGDVYDKAVVLLQCLVKKHPFASGNRRTAFITTKDFIIKNKAVFGIKDDPLSARVMQGVRENFYAHDEIKEWIQNGKIREFKR